MLNLMSLLLGICSCGLGLAALVRKGSRSLSSGSCTFCALALLLQLFEIRRRVEATDWSGLMDTVPSVTTAAVVLLVVTVFLNAVALYQSRTAR